MPYKHKHARTGTLGRHCCSHHLFSAADTAAVLQHDNARSVGRGISERPRLSAAQAACQIVSDRALALWGGLMAPSARVHSGGKESLRGLTATPAAPQALCKASLRGNHMPIVFHHTRPLQYGSTNSYSLALRRLAPEPNLIVRLTAERTTCDRSSN